MNTHDSTAPRRVIILGSTGSIGTNTLEVLQHLAGIKDESTNAFQVVGLAAGHNAKLLAEQARTHGVDDLAIAEEPQEGLLPTGANVRCGRDAAMELIGEIARPNDLVVGAMVGAAGIPAILAAIDIGCDIALANKETLVAAGQLVTTRAGNSGSMIIPIDSEHSAIFQLLQGTRDPVEIRRLILTASGGPFRTWSHQRMYSAKVEEALAHPTWMMGPKVTIDSASLMNKGLELIEAHWLYNVPASQLDAIMHPQSIVHSFVEFRDGSVVGQLAPPDMRLPIQYALTWPKRLEGCATPLSFQDLASLQFEEIDPNRFPAIGLARDAIERGGTAGAIFNAANETAVEAFLAGDIPFGMISEIVADTATRVAVQPADTFPAIQAADAEARETARARIATTARS